ncbi:hypothetical protein BpHYR1_024634 [Brachionus plicatilis]|uniref:Uncharacterized protein n=1 Tax=Brachionus plicatilis TaxID=10195 RepID=A0A3M7SH28_BRAPC|nr:hypothetical protein BpHYR1_024634 [Brachionus plicatilis]
MNKDAHGLKVVVRGANVVDGVATRVLGVQVNVVAGDQRLSALNVSVYEADKQRSVAGPVHSLHAPHIVLGFLFFHQASFVGQVLANEFVSIGRGRYVQRVVQIGILFAGKSVVLCQDFYDVASAVLGSVVDGQIAIFVFWPNMACELVQQTLYCFQMVVLDGYLQD